MCVHFQSTIEGLWVVLSCLDSCKLQNLKGICDHTPLLKGQSHYAPMWDVLCGMYIQTRVYPDCKIDDMRLSGLDVQATGFAYAKATLLVRSG
jgi:hypothetical protein